MELLIFVYIILGLVPSLVWLAYYLREDMHPEPKRMILEIFFWGALITIPVFFVQVGLANLLEMTNLNSTIFSIIYWFLIIAFSEEFFKYLVFRVKVFNSPHLDEPLDVMLYMVVAALGFTAIENILYLFSPAGPMSFDQSVTRALIMVLIRFIGATFLHTLCSATAGYFLAISIQKAKKKYIPLILGLLIATVLHGLYDFSLMATNNYIKIGVPIAIIVVLAVFVFTGFSRLQKMKSVCKV